MSTYELTRLVESAKIRKVRDVSTVNDQQTVKQGSKGCFNVVAAYHEINLIYYYLPLFTTIYHHGLPLN